MLKLLEAGFQSGDDPHSILFLTCVSCGTTKELKVRRERDLKGKVYWECITCRKQDRLFGSSNDSNG